MTANTYICNSAINYIYFNIPFHYFPKDKFQESINYLGNW